MKIPNEVTLEIIVSLAKRRGFIFQSGEIYGGLGSVWDYGPYGSLMKENIKTAWRKKFIQERDDVFLIDSSILTKREVLKASGHESGFSDPLVECKICHERFRSDKEIPEAKNHKHDLTEPKQFNLMFKTYAGPVDSDNDLVYLRPETAQGMFTEFANVSDSVHKKLPFGIAQIGKAFRNEITTGNFIFRTREFEQMEIEYFVKPGEDEKAFSHWVSNWEQFFYDHGLSKDKLHQLDVPDGERAHYSKRTIDLEYDFHFGKE
jgi:glycyl-tRNA synthetase